MPVDVRERREKILRLIINSYIDSGMPVSSRAICTQFPVGLCAASVRNVMADLEEMGLITHMHTSAGRVPTDKGYRFYVDRLLDDSGLTHQEQTTIHEEFFARQLALEEVMRKTSKVLSRITRYAAVVSYPQIKQSCFRRIQFMHLGLQRFCVTLITDTGVTKSAVVNLAMEVDADTLQRIESFLNAQLSGTPLAQMKTKLRRMMIKERNSFFFLLKQAIDLIDLSTLVDEHTELYFEGISNILEFPELADVETVMALVRAFDNQEVVARYLSHLTVEQEDKGVRVVIGQERQDNIFKGCALVVGSYRIEDRAIGTMGIIGPKRMDYGRSIATVGYVADLLSDMLHRFSV